MEEEVGCKSSKPIAEEFFGAQASDRECSFFCNNMHRALVTKPPFFILLEESTVLAPPVFLYCFIFYNYDANMDGY